MKSSLAPGRTSFEARRARRRLGLALVALAFTSVASFAIAEQAASANAELDRSYALESVAALRSSDNVDELFADYVAAAYKDYFAKQSRFVYQELGRADTLLEHSKLPYQKLIEDNDVLGQLARTARAESIIRTRILKEGPEYHFKLEWLHSPRMEQMASDEFTLQESAEPNSGGAHQVALSQIHAELAKSLDRMIAKVPFVGDVTGRDGESVTVNLGAISGLHRGDELVIGTLEEAKKHPLLHAIVDWRFAETGRALVESVDERIGFARVTAEEPGRRIARYQKILRVIPRATEKAAAPAPLEGGAPGSDGEAQASPTSDERPRLGWVEAGPLLGSFGRQYAPATGTGQSGGGLALGMKADAEVWFNRMFFADLGVGYSFWGYSQQPLVSGVTSGASSDGVSASLSTLRADVGYTYLLTQDFFGPKGWVKAGYKSSGYTFPTSTTELTGPITFKDLFVGVGGELPIRGRWGGLLNFEFGLFPSASEAGFSSGSPDSTHDIDFSLGAFYQYTNRVSFRCYIDVLAQGVDFTSGTSLSQKLISVIPMAVYSF